MHLISIILENPWRTGLTGNVFEIRAGFANVPTGPGLGIEVNQRMVDKFAV